MATKTTTTFSLILENFLRYFTLSDHDTSTLAVMDSQTLDELDRETI